MKNPRSRRVAFQTLGCKLNYAETGTISKQFLDRGYEVVDFGEPADVFVLNTCSVTERADRECRQLVRRALRVSPEACTIVVGCYAQLHPEDLATIRGVDYVLGAKEKFDIFGHIGSFEKRGQARIYRSAIHEATDFGPAFTSGAADRTRAFLKVQDGCDYHCAFCTIPLARGVSRSQSIAATVSQARELVGSGYKEVVLTGVNVGDYRLEDGATLVTLLRRLEEVDGLERIRVSSIEPNLLTREIIEHVRESDKMCHHFHVPLQSGCDAVLRLMRRRYLSSYYKQLVYSIKESLPDAAIGADVIVGFPGENDRHFQETYEFLVDLPVSYLHVFTYSERPNTAATKLPNVVDPRERATRSEMLRILSAKKRHRFYEKFVGTTGSVLMEGVVEGQYRTGFTKNYIRVGVPSESVRENQIVEVRISEAGSDFCPGEVVMERHIPMQEMPVTLVRDVA